MHQPFVPRRQSLTLKGVDPAGGPRRAKMNMDLGAAFQRLGFAVEQPQAGIDPGYRGMERRVENPVTALDRVFLQPPAGDVEGAALAGHRLIGLAVMGANTAQAHWQTRGRQHQRIVASRAPGNHRAGNHQTDTAKGKTAVDGKAEPALALAGALAGGGGREMLFQRFDPLAGGGAEGKQRRVRQGRIGQQGRGLIHDPGHPVAIDQVGLGHRHGAFADA